MQENKLNYFYLSVTLDDVDDLELFQSSLDSFFKDINVKTECYGFESLDKKSYVYFFKTEIRKRLFNIKRLAEIRFSSKFICEYGVFSSNRNDFYQSVDKFKNSSSWFLFSSPIDTYEYDGSDLSVFLDFNNFYSWQKKVYDMLFNELGNLKDADGRKIICIIDVNGNKGKSSFVKFLCWNKINNICKFGYGLSSQLRSSVIHSGARDCYIIDLPRTKGVNDKMSDLISVIEEIKNGFLTSPMYGKFSSLLMKPPFVLVFSNTHLPYHMLSNDRWDCYEITSSKNPDLKKISLLEFYRKEKIKKFSKE